MRRAGGAVLVALALATGGGALPAPADGSPRTATVRTATVRTAAAPAPAPEPAQRPAAGKPTKPVVQRITPASGPTGGGFAVVLKGSGFTGVKRVLVGEARATQVTVASSQRITARVPAHAAGPVRVRVITDHGSSGTTAQTQVTYVAPPAPPPPPPPPPPPATSVTAVSPGSGPTSGGTTVTLTGTSLGGATAVRFGGSAATAYRVVSDSRISATTPARPAGPVNVTVTAPNGTSVVEDGFTYVAAPTLEHVAPSSGPVAGSTATLVGSGLTSDLAVTFGGVPATEVRAAADGLSLTVHAPAHAPGFVDVAVGGAGGTANLQNGYRYVGSPDLVAVAPGLGPTAGGTDVVLTGTGFTRDTVVLFGTSPSLAVSANPPGTELTARLPARTVPGAVDVTVATAGGSDLLAGGFTYLAAPTLTSVAPALGPAAGGTDVTLAGTGFRAGMSVALGGVPATVLAVSATAATVTTPAHAPGPVDVVVTTPGGSATLADAFTFVVAPTLASVDPDAGPAAGGALVRLTGTGFRPGMSVTVGGAPATVDAVSATTATVTTPAHDPGPVTVSVTTAGGSASLVDGYTYVDAPTLTSLTPTEGPAGGGSTVILAGSGFTDDMSVTFGGRDAAVDTVTATSATVTTPVHAPGPVTVVVSNAGGTATLVAAYTYLATPTVTAVVPGAGPTAGGTSVTLTGTGFRDEMSVRFGGTPATLVAVSSGTSATVTVPAHAAAVVDVSVVTAGGTGTLPGGYEYVVAPTLVLLSPTEGPATGGQTVTLTGSGLRPDTQVRFGGTLAAVDSVSSSGTVATVTTPAHAAGPVDVTVTTAGGTATATPGYAFVAAPTLTAVSSLAGPAAGGQAVTLTGTGFRADLTVSFGGQPAAVLGPPTSTEATVVTPPHPAGPVDVVVATVGGTAAVAYTFVDPPQLTSVTPDEGPASGGQTVTVAGSGFRAGVAVSLGGRPATVVSVTDGSVTVSTPAHPAGPVDVTVTTPGGTATRPAAYTFVAEPTVTSLSPAAGPTTGLQAVTVTGTGFGSDLTVSFGGQPATVVGTPSATEATLTTPAHAAGVVDVVITTAGGTATAASAYAFVAPPRLDAVTPAQGPVLGGTTITLQGSGFTGVTTVTLDGQAASITALTDTTITATTPPHAVGSVDVSVTTPFGSDTLEDGFAYDLF